MTDVQTLGDELVAAGFASSGDGLDGAVWTSTNATDWTRVPDPKHLLGGPGDQVINRLLTTKPVEGLAVPPIVAGGTSTVDGNEDAAIWYSTDGTTWNREGSSGRVLGGDGTQAVITIAQDDRSLVAVGTDASTTEQRAGVWTAAAPSATTSPSGSAAP
jgi:hypothetical protein